MYEPLQAMTDALRTYREAVAKLPPNLSAKALPKYVPWNRVTTTHKGRIIQDWIAEPHKAKPDFRDMKDWDAAKEWLEKELFGER